MQRLFIDLGIDRNGLKAQVLTGPDDTNSNLSSVRNKYFLEQGTASCLKMGLDYNMRGKQLDNDADRT
jgi:hypothetical protein